MTALPAAACLLFAAAAPSVAIAEPTQPSTLTHPLAPSGEQCGMCHAFTNPASQASLPNISPMAWQGSAMAHSARDPVFWAALALASQDHPDETVDCVRCHVPNAFLSGRGDVVSSAQLEPADLDGVGCDLCHRMVADPGVPIGNARYTIDDTDINGAVPKAGPWAYTDEAPNHPWRQDLAYLPGSESCGMCHDVTTERPRVDDDGVEIAAGFNEQRTFSEWRNSDFAGDGPDAATCQDCHMPEVPDAAGCAAFSAAGITHPTGGRRHDLAGPNRGLTAVMRATYGSAGDQSIDDAFYDVTEAAQDVIIAQALALEVQAPAEVTDAIDLVVTLENLSGHKLPSGYSEGRVMWIEVRGEVSGAEVLGSGRWDGAVIEDDAQVRRYEAIAERLADGTRNHLLLNDHWVVDDRLPPRGLLQDLETDPVGDRYALTADGTWPHVDSHTYSFTLDDAALEALAAAPPGEATVDVQVTVRYLINTPDYLAQLIDDNVINDAGVVASGAYALTGGPQPITFAAWSGSIPYTGGDEAGDGDGDGGAGDTSAEDTGPGAGESPGRASDQGCGCHAAKSDEFARHLAILCLMGACFGPLARRRRARSVPS